MSLLRSAATVGGLTMISRLLGFVRDQLVAFVIGTGPVAEAFFVAQRFPNLFRTLFAEGAFNSAFVPLFAKKVEGEGEAAAHNFAIDVFSVLLTWLFFFSAAAMVAMPAIIYVIAPGFWGSGSKFALAVELTRISFPYLLFISLTALQSGVLNSLNRFTAAAAAPILLNLVMISSNVVVWLLGTGNTEATGRILAWGLFLSGVAQFLLLALACKSAGLPLLPRFPRLTADVKTVVRLSVPGIISGGITQINLLIATMIATTIDRAVSYLYYADRVYQLPLGVIGVAIGIVLLPDLSRKLRGDNEKGAIQSQCRALELSLFLTLPSAVALMAIPRPIIQAVFEHGVFHHQDTLAVAPALMIFATALPAFAVTKVLQPGYYAREDTLTPMQFAIMSVVTNVVASLILVRWFGHLGIAMGTSAAAWVNASLLGVTLTKRGHFMLDDRLRRRLPRIVFAALTMGFLLLVSNYILLRFTGDFAGTANTLWGLAVLVAIGISTYFTLAHFVGAMRLNEFRTIFWR